MAKKMIDPELLHKVVNTISDAIASNSKKDACVYLTCIATTLNVYRDFENDEEEMPDDTAQSIRDMIKMFRSK